ncbi:conserved exported hypothetical protein [Candidatus Sulfopaludibacter sp. SbA3]|nr:conserved exported hypothetical protein [Candidatus Sulfopaludibacter sp. SbA3]
MVSHLAKLFGALVLLAAMWGLNTVGQPQSHAFLRTAESQAGPVRILRFYASVGLVMNGESAEICYGVENAKSVHISPPLPGVYPSARRCLQVVPEHTTHYTILAEGYDGRVAMQSLTLPVQSGPAIQAPAVNYALVQFPNAAAMAFSASGPITSYPASLGCSPSQVSSLRSMPCSSSMAAQ